MRSYSRDCRENVRHSENVDARLLKRNAAGLVEEIWLAPFHGHRYLKLHLDDVLLWLGETRGRSASIIDQAGAASGYDRIELREKALAQLDRVFLRYGSSPWEVFGLDSDASISVVKSRYRRFQKIFHPDRNSWGDGEFHHCSELLNRAYSGIRNHRRNLETASGFSRKTMRAPRPTVDFLEQRYAGGGKQSNLMVKTRRMLGSSARVRKRVFSTLILVSLLMITMLVI